MLQQVTWCADPLWDCCSNCKSRIIYYCSASHLKTAGMSHLKNLPGCVTESAFRYQ